MAGLFHDPSIGNPIHITIVRLILLEDEEVRSHVTSPCPLGWASPARALLSLTRAALCGVAQPGPPWPTQCHLSPLADPLLGPLWQVPVGAVVRLETGLGTTGLPAATSGPLSPAFLWRRIWPDPSELWRRASVAMLSARRRI